MFRVVKETGDSGKIKVRGNKRVRQDAITALPCSPNMKTFIRKFIRKEFEKKRSVSCLPEDQVKHAVIHRYEEMVANSVERQNFRFNLLMSRSLDPIVLSCRSLTLFFLT